MQGRIVHTVRSRRRIISDALKRAQEHFEVPRDSILKPTASITLTGGERVVARHIDFEDERVELIVTAKDGYFDTVITHVDDITAVRISDDGRRKHVEPANAEFVMKKFVGEVVGNRLCRLLSDDVDLRELVRTDKGLERIEEAAIHARDDNLPGAVADAIDHGKYRLGELSEIHRDALCHVFATSAAHEMVENSWKPFIREVDWMAAIVASSAKTA